jgi:hypothetical protein
VKRGKQLLEQTGAEEIGTAGEATADYAMSDRPASRI